MKLLEPAAATRDDGEIYVSPLPRCDPRLRDWVGSVRRAAATVVVAVAGG